MEGTCGIGEHWFWWLITMACVVWYSSVTIYVTIKGSMDVRSMLRRLGKQNAAPAPPAPGSKTGTE